MKIKPKHIVIVLIGLLLCMGVSAKDYGEKGKWSGEVSALGGSNFHLSPLNKKTHNLGELGGKIAFSKKKYSFDLGANLSAEHQLTGKAGGNIRIADNDTTKKADASVNENKSLNTQASANFNWMPDKINSFKAYYIFSCSKNTPDNYNLTTIRIDSLDFDYSNENGSKKSFRHNLGLKYVRQITKTDALLTCSYDAELYSYDEYTEWVTGKAKADLQEKEITKNQELSRYRSTPDTRFNNGKFKISYQDKKFVNVEYLDVEFSLNFQYKNLIENRSAANYVNQQWRDSIPARENFHYRTLSIVPLSHVRYNVAFYKLDLTVSPDYFAYKLDGNSQVGHVDRGKIANLFDMTHAFDLSPGHTLSTRFSRNDDRPDYLQICWFPRYSSVYANEIYMGNPDLKNSVTTSARLSYDFSYKMFSTQLTVGDVFKPRKIEQTYSNEVIDGKEYRVYTWINGGKSNEVNTSLSLGWNGRILAASLSGRYNYYKGISVSESVTKSSDYSFSSLMALNLQSWRIEANASYQSGMDRTYYSISSIIDGNFKVAKRFGDHLSIYLFGQNLLDHPVTVKTVSEDETEVRYERYLNYKRFLKLGINWSF